WVHDVLDLCLMCKACKSECPSNVDLAKLKAEFLNHYYQDKRRPLGHVMMAHVHRMNRLGAPLSPLVNWLQERRVLRWLLEQAATAAEAGRRCTPTTSAAGSRGGARRRAGERAPARRRPGWCCWTTASRRTTSRKSAGRRCACWRRPAAGWTWRG